MCEAGAQQWHSAALGWQQHVRVFVFQFIVEPAWVLFFIFFVNILTLQSLCHLNMVGIFTLVNMLTLQNLCQFVSICVRWLTCQMGIKIPDKQKAWIRVGKTNK